MGDEYEPRHDTDRGRQNYIDVFGEDARIRDASPEQVDRFMDLFNEVADRVGAGNMTAMHQGLRALSDKRRIEANEDYYLISGVNPFF